MSANTTLVNVTVAGCGAAGAANVATAATGSRCAQSCAAGAVRQRGGPAGTVACQAGEWASPSGIATGPIVCGAVCPPINSSTADPAKCSQTVANVSWASASASGTISDWYPTWKVYKSATASVMSLGEMEGRAVVVAGGGYLSLVGIATVFALNEPHWVATPQLTQAQAVVSDVQLGSNASVAGLTLRVNSSVEPVSFYLLKLFQGVSADVSEPRGNPQIIVPPPHLIFADICEAHDGQHLEGGWRRGDEPALDDFVVMCCALAGVGPSLVLYCRPNAKCYLQRSCTRHRHRHSEHDDIRRDRGPLQYVKPDGDYRRQCGRFGSPSRHEFAIPQHRNHTGLRWPVRRLQHVPPWRDVQHGLPAPHDAGELCEPRRDVLVGGPVECGGARLLSESDCHREPNADCERDADAFTDANADSDGDVYSDAVANAEHDTLGLPELDRVPDAESYGNL